MLELTPDVPMTWLDSLARLDFRAIFYADGKASFLEEFSLLVLLARHSE
jgi:hypothetical protein